MKTGFYARLAVDGIRKNRRLYVPYLAACAGMAGMFYIVAFLSGNGALAGGLEGGRRTAALTSLMNLGEVIVALFAAIFLFYTNSFLMRRRRRELGLYNILGMGKRNIARILVWETLLAFLVATGAGLALGVAFSKMAELVLLRIVRGEATYALTFSPDALWETAAVFAVIFALMLLSSLRRVRRSGALALLRSESVGEKPPRANWALALLGLALLGAGYAAALSIQDPIDAMVWFFAAVAVVIIGTYLLFIAGSVAACRLLQKRRGWYYRARHFVSVSSMAFRMKRNGAGLASICVLVTMVLVMLSSTSSLYFGTEALLMKAYPAQFRVTANLREPEHLDGDNIAPLRDAARACAAAHGTSAAPLFDYRCLSMFKPVEGGVIHLEAEAIFNDPRTAQFYFVNLDDYNAMTGAAAEAAPGEALLCEGNAPWPDESVSFAGGEPLRVAGGLPPFAGAGNENTRDIVDYRTYTFVVADLAALAGEARRLTPDGTARVRLRWLYGFDTGLDEKGQLALAERLSPELGLVFDERCDGDWVSVYPRAAEKADFYDANGGLFFLGILLSLVFLLAAVLILYYKQVSEGYEDSARFGIMRKVGMSAAEIRRSVDAQISMVFALPPLMALCHMAFAFPMVGRLLMLFQLYDTALFLRTTALCFAFLGLLYIAAYHATANAYCAIVSGAGQD